MFFGGLPKTNSFLGAFSSGLAYVAACVIIVVVAVVLVFVGVNYRQGFRETVNWTLVVSGSVIFVGTVVHATRRVLLHRDTLRQVERWEAEHGEHAAE